MVWQSWKKRGEKSRSIEKARGGWKGPVVYSNTGCSVIYFLFVIIKSRMESQAFGKLLSWKNPSRKNYSGEKCIMHWDAEA